MKALDRDSAIERMNVLGGISTPFLFVISYRMEENYMIPLSELEESDFLVHMPSHPNASRKEGGCTPGLDVLEPVSYERYSEAFRKVTDEIRRGNSYLLNLTFPTRVRSSCSPEELFHRASAPYKLMMKGRFLLFSPEIFLRIRAREISSFPMKGTIDADLPGAADTLLKDAKESAEHNTIVDLIRNDLSMVATQVRVKRFRYLEEIKTTSKNLLQASSEITGILNQNYAGTIGDIVFTQLPAGSVTGAPKKKTLDIIEDAEQYERGFYTGVFGIFDGENLDSAVMIRFLEESADGTLWYKSGGGITAFSSAEKEYQELIDKVYVPVV